MGHSYNFGIVTSSKGLAIEALRLTALNTTTPVVAEDCKAGLVASVSKGVTGQYTFQLNAPYPPKVVNITAHMSAAGPTAAILNARYRNASYNPVTGQFIVDLSNATPVAADGGAADEMHVFMVFNRYTR